MSNQSHRTARHLRHDECRRITNQFKRVGRVITDPAAYEPLHYIVKGDRGDMAQSLALREWEGHPHTFDGVIEPWEAADLLGVR